MAMKLLEIITFSTNINTNTFKSATQKSVIFEHLHYEISKFWILEFS